MIASDRSLAVLPRLLSLALSLSLALGVSPAFAAPRRGKAKPAAAETAEVANPGRTVALLRFSGAASSAELSAEVATQIEQAGFTVKKVALDLPTAAERVKCSGDPGGAQCMTDLGQWLASSPKTASDFIVGGDVSITAPTRTRIVVFEVATNTIVRDTTAVNAPQDLILPLVLPQSVATALKNQVEPPGAATAEEEQLMAALDEPEQTPEERAALAKAIEDAESDAANASQGAVIDTGDIAVDLRKDFKDFCRTGPRKKRESRDEPKDLRPACKRGPVWGYWQPRAYVALALVSGAALGTIAFYSLALAARGPYKQAVDDLDAYNGSVGANPRQDPNAICNGELCYDALATEVSRTGAIMKRRAIVGDVLLGTTAALGAVLGVIIYQDRSAAKTYIRQEKGLRAISDVRVGPMLSRENKGFAMSFRF